MSDRKIILVNETSGKQAPFWDRHFAPILALTGALIAAFFAISDNALNLIVNQPPTVEIKISKNNAEVGHRVYARGQVNDPGGDPNEISYRWEIFELDTILLEGVGIEYDRVDLPTEKAGTYTLMVTVTDKNGKGKYARNEAIFIVVDAEETQNTVVLDQPVSSPPPKIAQSIEYTPEIVLTENTDIDWNKTQASRIITNGYSLAITGKSIDSDLSILSFSGNATKGKDGSPGSPGANGGREQDGQPGLPGTNGGSGVSGKKSGVVTIRVTNINSDLTIKNVGQSGGIGGKGGDGGGGGIGGQGRPAVSGVFDCSRGPGRGGKGGDGGAGGQGGEGGNGGSSGEVKVIVAGIIEGKLDISTKGGSGGFSGKGGLGGAGGRGGKEGRATGICQSAGRSGPNGAPGISGKSGASGKAGDDSLITIHLQDKVLESNGLYKN